jgi:hypothetical protein
VVLTAALALAAAAAGGCGGDAGHGYRVGTLADCATAGPVRAVADPAGDQSGGKRYPRGDLVRAAVGAGAGGICADLRLAADAGPTSLYAIGLRPQYGDAPLVTLEASLLAGRSPDVVLRVGSRIVARAGGRIGVRGDRLTLTVGAEPVRRAGGAAVLARGARSEARTAVANLAGAATTDCAPRC